MAIQAIQIYSTTFFYENDILSTDAMSSTKSNFELFLGLTRLIYVWINFGFGKSQSYIILQIIKSFNGLLILYELLNHHLIYNNSLRRLTIILAGIFVSLNVSSLFSLVLWQSKITYVDPLILTMIPGMFFVKYCYNLVDNRIFDVSYNLI